MARSIPDVVPRRGKRQEASALRRGKLKIFFGFAPGVGKTYRMLQVARDLVCDQKLDVVVGVVDTHRRHETAALVLGLELLSYRKATYRGRVLEEFDIDAALARKPKLILVDELAHTNAPGSRHAKRWQDVDELLDAGIDVFSTMNVQHMDSLNDVIAQITRVQVRETVPDSVLDRADSIELVDVAPEELLQRLKEGKVYLPEQAERAAEHFFQRGNLLALRELALHRTAAHVDDAVREYREEHGVTSTWPAGERILVCVGPAPSSGRLIRAAARMAGGLRCPWIAAYVEPSGLEAMNDTDRARLEAHLRLAESLGATVTRLAGRSIADALVVYAQKHNVTRIVVGKPTHWRLRDRVQGSLLEELVRGSGDIEVHVTSGGAHDESTRHDPRLLRSAPSQHYVWAVGIIALSVAVAALLRALLGLPDLEMLFLLAVMVTAVRFGRGPSLVSAALGVACYDFFFVAPMHTFSVSDHKYFLTFVMMFGVSFAMSELAERLRRQEHDARTREERTALLYALTKELAATDSSSRIAAIGARTAADIFGAGAVVLASTVDGELRSIGGAPMGVALDANELAVARWAYEHDALAGLGTDTLPGAQTLCAPLRVGPSRLGVLALVLARKAALRQDQRAILDVFCRQLAVALERARLAEEAETAALRAKTEEMRASILSAVSHDLRTPLASITGAATTLREAKLSEETKRDLVDSIVDQAERLERLVANLLDMTRLESGGLALKKDWVPLDEIVGSALTRLEARLGNRKVTVEIASDVPLLLVDPVLFEQVFVNLLENAEKYTPCTAAIDIRARSTGDSIVIDVSDRGPGLPAGTEARVFDKFYRGTHTGVSGAGLGLPICKGIIEAHGGAIVAENGALDGAIFHVTVPRSGTPPALVTARETA